LGTISPLTIGMTAENQWAFFICCQPWQDDSLKSRSYHCLCQHKSRITSSWA